jgi:hypothetical protein
MNLFKLTPLSTMLAALFSAPALAACPGIAPTAGSTNPLPYPAITKIEFENPSAPSKPWPAIGSDRAQVIGGSLTKGKLVFLITLERAVPSGCELKFNIYDDGLTDYRRARSDFDYRRVANTIIPYRRTQGMFADTSDISVALGNGTNKVRVPVTIAPSQTDRAMKYKLKLTLDTNFTYHPVMPVVPFEFQNNPLVLESVEPLTTSRGRNGSTITEFVARLNEPVSSSLNEYYLLSGDIRINRQTDLGVFVNYYAIPSAGAFVGDITPQDGAIRSPFDASYADRGNHVFFELKPLQSTPITAQLVIGDGVSSNVEIGKRLTINLERR